MRQLSYLQLTLRVLQGAAIFAAATLAIAMLTYTIFCAFGATAWLSFPMTFGEMTVLNAGMYMQIGLTVLVCAVALMIPTNMRMNALERTHRSFQMSMDDVARAYHLCHTADRASVFTFSSEFDAVRERLAYLRDHPDLVRLEPDVLEVAAQMSQQSRHLADVYSDEKVERAKQFLTNAKKRPRPSNNALLWPCTSCKKPALGRSRSIWKKALWPHNSNSLMRSCKWRSPPLAICSAARTIMLWPWPKNLLRNSNF
jgi:hypothetical protein